MDSLPNWKNSSRTHDLKFWKELQERLCQVIAKISPRCIEHVISSTKYSRYTWIFVTVVSYCWLYNSMGTKGESWYDTMRLIYSHRGEPLMQAWVLLSCPQDLSQHNYLEPDLVFGLAWDPPYKSICPVFSLYSNCWAWPHDLGIKTLYRSSQPNIMCAEDVPYRQYFSEMAQPSGQTEFCCNIFVLIHMQMHSIYIFI